VRASSRSKPLYDPLSYHNGSVWPLFTGWASMGAYRYGRPHVGYQALNGECLAHFHRCTWICDRTCCLATSTHLSAAHLIIKSGRRPWSSRLPSAGCSDRGKSRRQRVAVCTSVPANWNQIEARNVPAGNTRFDITLEREIRRLTVKITRRGALTVKGATMGERITVAPAFRLTHASAQLEFGAIHQICDQHYRRCAAR